MLKTPKRWTPEEDRVLLREVSQSCNQEKAKDWTSIAEKLPGRSNKDCRKRWYNQHVGGLKKGPWDPSEDKRLRIGVEEYGDQWTLVAEEVATRSADQCAKRWHHSLNPNLDQSKWSPEEDHTLMDAVQKRGRAWRQIQMEHFPDRASNNVKNRYVTLTRKRQSRSHDHLQWTADKSDHSENGSDNGEDVLASATASSSTKYFEEAQSPYLPGDTVMENVDQSPYWQDLLDSHQLEGTTSTFPCDEMASLINPSNLSVLPSTGFSDDFDSFDVLLDQPTQTFPIDSAPTSNSGTSVFDTRFTPSSMSSGVDETTSHGKTPSHISGVREHHSTAFALTIDDPSPETITGVMNFLAHSKTKFKLEIK